MELLLNPLDGANRGGVMLAFVKVTAAADVNANGYTVNEGSNVVSGVTKTAEGKAKLALTDPSVKFLGIWLTTTLTGSFMILENDSSTSGSDPHLDVIFEIADGTDTDPDAAVMYFLIAFKNNNG